jgi:flavin-dependent dehydrogenase
VSDAKFLTTWFLKTQKKQKNVSVKENFQITDIIQENDYVTGIKGIDLNTKKEETIKTKIVVGADGAHSVIATKLGVNKVDQNHYVTAIRAYYENVKDLNGTIEIHFVDELIPGYFWIFPLENGKANVGAGILFSEIKKRDLKLTESMFKAIKENKMFKERFKNAKLLGQVKGWTLPLGSKKRKAAFNGALLVGDAASLIDPFTGEGVGKRANIRKTCSTHNF